LKTSKGSAGGLKDYWTMMSGRLGLTIEVGNDRFPHPYPLSELGSLVEKHKKSIELIANMGEGLWKSYKNT